MEALEQIGEISGQVVAEPSRGSGIGRIFVASKKVWDPGGQPPRAKVSADLRMVTGRAAVSDDRDEPRGAS